MNLIIDIGNTLTKVAITENDNIVLINRYEVFSKEIFNTILTEYSPSKGIISTVGKIDAILFDYIKSKIPIAVLNHKSQLPITILYKTPQTLGLDRVAVAVGANHLYPSTDILVIDCGTAITYDLINRRAEYIGGAISPGILIRYKSLYQNTLNLPLVSKLENAPIIGASTAECIESGVLNGAIGELEYFITRVKENYPDLKVLITGGDSSFFVNKLKNSIFVNQNLVIIGLNRILEFNA